MTPVESTSTQAVESLIPRPPIAESIGEPEMGDEELSSLESVIERGHQTFIEVGEALLAIRERRGYRAAGYATFEAYLKERWAGVGSAGIN